VSRLPPAGWLLLAALALLPSPGPGADLPEEPSAPGDPPPWEAGIPAAEKADPALLAPLLDSLRGIERLTIRVRPQGAVLEGTLLTTEDLARVERVASRAAGVVNLCRLDPDALARTASHLEAEMRRMGITGLSLRPAGGQLLLGGTPSSPRDIARARSLCRAVGLAMVDATAAEGPGQAMVLFEVTFTELNKQGFKELGVEWPSSLTLQDASGGRFDRLVFAESLQATIDLMVQRGEGRILSRPRLLCRSGESASFLAGGEIPIPTRTKEGEISVAWKHYGIILQVSPRVDAQGVISSRITAEVSTVDRANAVEGIPGILTRRVETGLVLAAREGVVLSGLVNSEDAQTVKEVPLLSSIPILGELFRSRSFQRRETELIVSLTPSLAREAPPAAPLP